MVDGTSDEELMASMMSGDRQALTILVERHYGSLLGYLFRLAGGSRTLAEDLVQETFATILRRGGYEVTRPFKPWLYAVATNVARDHFKSAAVRREVPTEHDAIVEMRDDDPGPEEHALAAEEGREVAQAVVRLGDEYRETILLRFYQGLSLREIAAALDVPVGTVKSRLSTGTRRLRELLARSREGANT